MKLKGIKIGDRFKLTVDGKRLTPDEAKRLAKLNVNDRIASRKSAETKQRFVPRGKALSNTT
jgi:hypothetical protein